MISFFMNGAHIQCVYLKIRKHGHGILEICGKRAARSCPQMKESGTSKLNVHDGLAYTLDVHTPGLHRKKIYFICLLCTPFPLQKCLHFERFRTSGGVDWMYHVRYPWNRAAWNQLGRPVNPSLMLNISKTLASQQNCISFLHHFCITTEMHCSLHHFYIIFLRHFCIFFASFPLQNRRG